MEIIEAPQLDLITPFPASQMHRIWGWSKAFSNLSLPDGGPASKEAFEEYMIECLATHISYGIIDRDNLLELPHLAPLVGIVIFEAISPYTGYLSIATSRSAWGTRMADQALQTAINHLFSIDPNLTKLSITVADDLVPVKALSRRVGGKLEGVLRGMIAQNGLLLDVAHYGLMYNDWAYTPTKLVLRKDRA